MNERSSGAATATRASMRPSLEALAASGVWAPTLVPLDADLAPDHARLAEHVRWLLGSGCHGVALFGTTSEANSFSVEERASTLEALLAAGIAPERLMVGTGCCAFTDSIRLTGHAAALGCKKVLMLPPFYFKNVSDEGLYASFARVIDAVADPALEVFLYHFPRMSTVPIGAELVERLQAAYPGSIAGVKDSSGEWSTTLAFLERCPGLAILPGSERFLLDGLERGAAGCLTATANVNQAAIRSVFDAWHRDPAAARAEAQAMLAVRSAFEAYPLVGALKHVVSVRHGDPAWRRVRPPLVPLGEHEGAALLESLRKAGLEVAPAAA